MLESDNKSSTSQILAESLAATENAEENAEHGNPRSHSRSFMQSIASHNPNLNVLSTVSLDHEKDEAGILN